jgi:hypothetical protein
LQRFQFRSNPDPELNRQFRTVANTKYIQREVVDVGGFPFLLSLIVLLYSKQ